MSIWLRISSAKSLLTLSTSSIQTQATKCAWIVIKVLVLNNFSGPNNLKSMIAGKMGTLNQLGHMDFYPDGGSSQHGCEEQADPDHPEDGGWTRERNIFF